MNLSWLQSAMMGFVSGLSEPLPMSSEAHRGLLRQLMGVESEGPLFLLMCHIAVLVVVLMTGRRDTEAPSSCGPHRRHRPDALGPSGRHCR